MTNHLGVRAALSIVTTCASAITMSLALATPANAGTLHAGALRDGETYDRFIVRFKPDAPERGNAPARQRALDAAGQAHGVRIGQLRRLAVGADVIKTDHKLDRASALQLMQRLAKNPHVDYVEPDAIRRALYVPNDPSYASQWHYSEAAAGINLPAAWNKATGSGVVVAVIDSGITTHTDLTPNVVAGYDFISDASTAGDGNGRDANPRDEGDWVTAGQCGAGESAANSSWHGTHVAGTIAAVTNNAKGVAGVAFNARIMPLRVLGHCGGHTSDIADAIVWAAGGAVPGVPANANPAEVINLSLGGPGACDATSQAAINMAVAAGTVVVVAAGNDNDQVAYYSPASCNNVITVAAVGRSGARASYSNYGAQIDVSAPGGDGANGVTSTLNAGTTVPGAETYGSYQGTSMAAPHVAGTVALMQSAKVNTPATVESLLKSTARPLPVACTLGCGAGIIDASLAIPYKPTLSIADVAIVEGNSGTTLATFTVKLSATSSSPVTFNVATANGTAVAGSDYVASTSTGQSIAAGLTSKTFAVTLNGDTTLESNETFTVNVSSVVGATVIDGQALGTIVNDDGPTLSIGNVAVTEGNAGTKLATYTVTLSKAATTAVSYSIATGNSTATAGSDFVGSSLSGQTIPAGVLSKTFAVTINGDATIEANEVYTVNLSNAVGATIARLSAIGTIVNDDGPTLSIADLSMAENNGGYRLVTFTVTLSKASASPVSYSIATANNTALAGADYVASSLVNEGMPAGTLTKSFAVQVNGDLTPELNETFLVNLSAAAGASIADSQAVGTILNDDLYPVTGITQIAAGEDFNCALTSAGAVKCWGSDARGTLGDGTVVTPVNGGLTQVSGLASGVVAVAAGYQHACALTSAGAVRCWGLNDHGQLGDNTLVDRLAPVNVVGLGSGVVAIAAGVYHTCALVSGGSVKCWGTNAEGELGDGTNISHPTPVTVTGLTGISKIATGWTHTCAVTSTGAMKCWGQNSNGQLGDNSLTDHWVPTDVTGLTSGVVAISAGLFGTCAKTSSGQGKCWGWNNMGQLGDGTLVDRWTAVTVSGLSGGVAAISKAQGYHTCAIVGTGARCWGNNGNGQLGDNSTAQRLTPVAVYGLSTGIAAIATGGYHTCALLSSSGRVKCWGYNWSGQLGDGTSTQGLVPVDVKTY